MYRLERWPLQRVNSGRGRLVDNISEGKKNEGHTSSLIGKWWFCDWSHTPWELSCELSEMGWQSLFEHSQICRRFPNDPLASESCKVRLNECFYCPCSWHSQLLLEEPGKLFFTPSTQRSENPNFRIFFPCVN